MEAVQQTEAQQWDSAILQLRETVQQAMTHLQDLEAAVQASYDSCEMGPEEWSEQSSDLGRFITRDDYTGISPEDAVREVFELIRSALEAGDSVVNREQF